MPLTVFHGDNIADSRRLLLAEAEKLKQAGYSVRTLEPSGVTPADLESTFATRGLFSTDAYILEGFLAGPRSRAKDRYLLLIAEWSQKIPLLLWEKKSVTKTSLGKFPREAKLVESKTPAVLFTFLDSLIPGNSVRALSLLHQVLLSQDELPVFTMVGRQVAGMISAASATHPKMPPWQLGKLKSQASKWELPELVRFHSSLLKIDALVKTGQTKLSYSDHLDILIVSLLG